MARLLYLVHRIPYPPNKGDKVRSYHVLRYLADRHDVHLGTFVDDPDDMPHVPTLEQWCASVKAVPLSPKRARLKSLRALVSNEPLTLAYYRDPALATWIEQSHRAQPFDAVVVFSSSMVPYTGLLNVPTVVDFVDVDSAKWLDYARARPWPLSWLYRREAQHLLAFERKVARRTPHCYFVTQREVERFLQDAPECASHVHAVGNGVDTAFFAPDAERPTPFEANEVALVFTGAMDYWPNEDAVVWFVANVMPAVRSRWPAARLSIVGRSPSPAVRALASPSVRVTGTVDDVRPWLQHARVVVAPLRLARGVQNKVLEAMAMARAVVAAKACTQALDVVVGQDLLAAHAAEDYVAALAMLLDDAPRAQAMGQAARRCVQAHYGWEARLRPIDAHLAVT
jgi:polysaccharide biosynthesis protein PslH